MKTPLKSRPLRNPGESLARYIDNRIFDGAMQYWIAAFFCWALALYEWTRWLTERPPSPGAITLIAIALTLIAVYRTVRTRQEVRHLRLGLDGEKAVGQFLERLRMDGAQVFHDIPGEGFNLDHAVVHATGVYVIETKMRSKPERGESRLIYDGESIILGGLPPDQSAVVQARAASHWLKQLLSESTGKTFPIRPVVVFPGWFIEPTAEAKRSDVWVLNPKALPSFIAHSAQQLCTEDVQLCAFHLSRYIRSHSG